MKDYYVYKIVEEGSKKILYIGKGKGRRIKSHLRFIRSHDKPNSYINSHLFYRCKSILKNGGDIYEEKILDNLTEEEALLEEEKLISLIGIDNLCNFSISGCSNLPPKGSARYDEYVKKLSDASLKRWRDPKYYEKMLKIRKDQGIIQRGDQHPMYGKTHTDELKEKLSKSHKGKKQSPESVEKTREKLIGREIHWKDKIGEANKISWNEKIKNGYIVPQETREKISESSTGKFDKILDQELSSKILELYKSFGPNRIRKQLLSEGYDISLYIIRRELTQSGIYKKYRKNSKL